jgi:uncharacterized protein YbaP (TraB family)
MLRFLFAFLTGMLSVGACTAKAPKAAVEERLSSEKIANSLLWKISGNGLSKPSYLFGTIHMICASDFVWTNAMQKAFGSAEKLCLEMDLDDPGLAMEAMMGMMATDGTKLRSYFTDAQWKKLDAVVKAQPGMGGMGLDMLQMMKPVMLLSMLSTKGVACDSTLSYEMVLMEKAKAGNKEVIGLETAGEQLSALNTLPTDSVIAQIVAFLDGTDEGGSKELNAMTAAYKMQNLGQLDTLINNSMSLGNAASKGALLDDRNDRWIARMTEKMKPASVFFGVGAGHLPGSKGVIQLLRKAGYKVEPLL